MNDKASKGKGLLWLLAACLVEAIVLGAEDPSRIRGGARLGGRGGPLENFVGDVTKYVVAKANCRVIVTAPAAGDEEPRAPEEEAAAAKS